MDGFFTALENSALAEALKTSFYVYPLVSVAHVLAIGALVTCVVLMDLRMLGRFASLPLDPFVTALRGVALGAFAIALITGFLLFSVRASDYAAMPLYWSKMALIVLAALNFAIFSYLDAARPPGTRPQRGQRHGAIVSILLWVGVAVAGRFLGFV